MLWCTNQLGISQYGHEPHNNIQPWWRRCPCLADFRAWHPPSAIWLQPYRGDCTLNSAFGKVCSMFHMGRKKRFDNLQLSSAAKKHKKNTQFCIIQFRPYSCLWPNQRFGSIFPSLQSFSYIDHLIVATMLGLRRGTTLSWSPPTSYLPSLDHSILGIGHRNTVQSPLTLISVFQWVPVAGIQWLSIWPICTNILYQQVVRYQQSAPRLQSS